MNNDHNPSRRIFCGHFHVAKTSLIGTALLMAFLFGICDSGLGQEQPLNHKPIWTAVDKLFCRGQNMFTCSFEDPISCDQSKSSASVTINFAARVLEFHGAYRGGGTIKSVAFADSLNPMQTILLDDNRVVHLAHYKFHDRLEISGYLLDAENVAYANPKETIKRGASGHTLICFPE